MESISFLDVKRAFALLLVLPALLFSQENPALPRTFSSARQDTNIIFESPNKNFSNPAKATSLLDAWGLDILVSNNGFGL